jgi:hypothetical protein
MVPANTRAVPNEHLVSVGTPRLLIVSAAPALGS